MSNGQNIVVRSVGIPIAPIIKTISHFLSRNSLWLLPLVKTAFKKLSLLINKNKKMEKGILSKELESTLAGLADSAIKLPGVWERLDGTGFKIAIAVIDDNVAEKIPEPYKAQITAILEKILKEKDYDAAAILIADAIDLLVDVPGIDDATEKFMFVGFFTALAGLLIKA